MGLFGKLFEKKVCCICGGEIGIFGNRKLSDGNMCKDCASKLSPWFSDRKESTAEEIKEQLEYREKNKEAVAAFGTTRTLGYNTKVHLDEKAKKFIVTAESNFSEANPDVMDFTQITGCDVEIREDRSESKQTVKQSDGTTKQVSYNPPHYTYSYDFWMNVHVNHKYFDNIRFPLNGSSINIDTVGPISGGTTSANMPSSLGNSIGGAILQGVAAAISGAGTNYDPRMSNPKYMECVNMGNEIKTVLMQAREQAIQEQTEAAAPKKAVTCPYCGATTIPNANGCCEYCGKALGV